MTEVLLLFGVQAADEVVALQVPVAGFRMCRMISRPLATP